MLVFNGDNFVDDRGMLTFFNDFDFSEVERMYQVRNHRAGFIRAWHGHKLESKHVQVVKGAALIGIASFDGGFVSKHILSEHKPQILYIPKMHYNGFKTLTDDTILQFFSSSSIEDAKSDDYRQPYNWINIWEESYR